MLPNKYTRTFIDLLQTQAAVSQEMPRLIKARTDSNRLFIVRKPTKLP